jgi:hypothetical protein
LELSADISAEVHGCGVSNRKHHADAFSRLGYAAMRQKSREGRRPTRFCHNAQDSPEHFLCVLNQLVAQEHNSLDTALCYRKQQISDAFRGK